ncbi:hypothetical protein [Spirosoma flavum]|uniref:Uncharacterized protein n=1 Tax=Spirosoma flavum TaxID=2048557 RepID=A0ABW6APM9_9BACT
MEITRWMDVNQLPKVVAVRSSNRMILVIIDTVCFVLVVANANFDVRQLFSV